MNEIQFVVGYPRNEQQRLQSRKIVQASAARLRWRKGTSIAKLQSAELQRHRLPSSSGKLHLERKSISDRQTERPNALGRAKRCHAGHNTQLQFQRILDTRVLPPMLPVQCTDLIKQSDLHLMLRNCHDKWLALFPTDIHSTEVADSWMTLMINSKQVFETFAFSHFQRLHFFQPSAKSRRLSVELYCRNVECINKTLQDPTKAIHKDNIFAVWTLALHAPLLESQPEENNGPRPSQGPLNSLQLVNYVDGIMRFVPVHRQGFFKLLELRGGLQSLDLGVAGYAFSLAELFFATLYLCRPRIEFLPSMSLDFCFSLAANRRTDHPLRRMGLGFGAMRKISSSCFCEQVRAALDGLALYSLGVDDYFAGRQTRKSLAVLAQERAFVQHKLASLYPEQGQVDDLNNKDGGICVFYQAGMIYSLLCVMPLPTAPFRTLVRQLRKQFRNEDFTSSWEKAPKLMTWVIVMFAIAAIGMPERAWAVAVLDRCSRRLMINSWDTMQELISEFLWLPITNDVDGMDLWDEIEQSNPFESVEHDQDSSIFDCDSHQLDG